MTGRVAVHAALTPQQRAELDARARSSALPIVRYPLLAYAVQRIVRGRGASGAWLGGHLHTLIRHNLQTAEAKERAREALRAQPGTVTFITAEQMAARLEADDGRQHDAPGR